MALYFIGILAPEDVQQQVLHWKHYMRQEFGCRSALKSPAHITLIPPFEMDEERQTALQESLEMFSADQTDFAISVRNFSRFDMKVIFAAVQDNPALDKLRKALEEWLVRADLFGLKNAERPFHPHITIATRDLRKKDFLTAWGHFSDLSYSTSFQARGLTILLHNGKIWNIAHAVRFAS